MSGAKGRAKPKFDPTPAQMLALRKKHYTDMTREEHFYMATGNRCQRPIVMFNEATKRCIRKNCESHSWKRCTYCTNLWVGDVIAFMKAGITDERIRTGQYFFVTLTAPSFGRVHTAAKAKAPDDENQELELIRCIPECGKYHHPDEGMAGVAFDSRKYRSADQGRWNANVGEILDRFYTGLNQRLGLGYPVSRVHVLEMQSRLALHAHVLLWIPAAAMDRLGGEEGMDLAIRESAAIRYNKRDGGPPLVWGKQVAIEPLLVAPQGATAEVLASYAELIKAVVLYVCKYLRKDLGVDPQYLSYKQSQHLTRINNHVREMIKPEYLAARNSVDFHDPDFKRKQARIVWKFNRIAESGGVRANVFGKSSRWAVGVTMETFSDVRKKFKKDQATGSQEPTLEAHGLEQESAGEDAETKSEWSYSRSEYLPNAEKQHEAHALTDEEMWRKHGPKVERLSTEKHLRVPELSVHGVFPSFLDQCDPVKPPMEYRQQARTSGERRSLMRV